MGGTVVGAAVVGGAIVGGAAVGNCSIVAGDSVGSAVMIGRGAWTGLASSVALPALLVTLETVKKYSPIAGKEMATIATRTDTMSNTTIKMPNGLDIPRISILSEN